MASYEVVIEVTGSVYLDVDADSERAAINEAVAEWSAGRSLTDVQNQRVSGVGVMRGGLVEIEPVS